MAAEMAGKTAKCSSCGRVFQVPVPAKASLPPVQPAIRTAQSEMQDPLIGRQIAHYRIQALLGEGGMGKVYKAHNTSLDKPCAIKILPPEFAKQDQTYIDRFVREARSAAKVEHPNVLPVHFVGKVAEHYFIEMQYVDGGTLGGLLKQRGKLPVQEAARIIRDVAAGLQAALEKGIVHRDMKPTNVMLTSKGHVYVMDFGLAKSGQGRTALTVSGSIMGTPLYMSPEQATAQPVDHRSDIYSLGVMFYQIVSGTPPYDADSALALISQHIHAPIPDVRQAAPEVPAHIADMIRKMMAKNPAERYQSCAEIVEELSGFLTTGGATVTVSEEALKDAPDHRKSVLRQAKRGAPRPTPLPAAGVVPRKRPAMPVVLVLLLVLALVLGAGAYLVAKGRKGSGTTTETGTENIQHPTPNIQSPSERQTTAAATEAAKSPWDEVYVTTAATGEKIPHPLSRKAYKQALADGTTIDVPEGMVYVPPGEFTMGQGDKPFQGPEHKVWLDGYLIRKYEVTNAEWKVFVEFTTGRCPSFWKNGLIPQGRENHPVTYISWGDAQKYCEWVGQMTGRDVRLPTEAQWEKAARGPKNLPYPWGDKWDPDAGNWLKSFLAREGVDRSPKTGSEYDAECRDFLNTPRGKELWDAGGGTTPVGSFPKDRSPHGCHDMAGNSSEWCADWYKADYYQKSPASNPQGPSEEEADTAPNPQTKGKGRATRGGSWRWTTEAGGARGAYRGAGDPTRGSPWSGLRCVILLATGPAGQKAQTGGAAAPSPAPAARSAWDDVYIATAATGEKIPHPLSQKTYTITQDGQTIEVPVGMVCVPAGEFTMGEGESEHQVYLDAYFIGKYEVTNAEWKIFCDITGFGPLPTHWKDGAIPAGKENHPVVYVSWEDIQKYCQWVSAETGRKASLPTEAQWEKAARGPKAFVYPWGNDWNPEDCNWQGTWALRYGLKVIPNEGIPNDQWMAFTKSKEYTEEICSEMGGMTMPVGSFRKDKCFFGCYDMAGNACEWCQDWLMTNYYKLKDAKRNPQGPTQEQAEVIDFGGNKSKARVLRGGSWKYSSVGCRSLYRPRYPSTSRISYYGFRLVLLPSKPEGRGQKAEAQPSPSGRFVFWKFLGSMLAVPGPDGKVVQLPAGLRSDMQYSPDGKCLALAHSFGVDLWDAEKMTPVQRLDGHKTSVRRIGFSPDGSRLASISLDGRTVVWDVNKGTELSNFETGTAYSAAAFSLGTDQMVTSGDKDILLWNLQTGKQLRASQGHRGHISRLAFSPGGDRFASAGTDKLVKVWNTETGALMTTLEGHSGPANSVAFSPDGKLVASGASDGGVCVWEAGTGRRIYVIKSLPYGDHVSFSPNGLILACACGAIHLWSVGDGKELFSLDDSTGLVFFHPTGKWLATGHSGGWAEFLVWDVATGEKVRETRAFGSPIGGVDFSPTDPNGLLSVRVPSGHQGDEVRLWDIRQEKELRALGRNVLQAVFMQDGRTIAGRRGRTQDETLLLLDAQTGAEHRQLAEWKAWRKDSPAWAVCNNYFAYALEEGGVRIGPGGPTEIRGVKASALAFNPEQNLLAVGCKGDDEKVYLFDPASGREVRVLAASGARDIKCLAFSPDGRRLAIGDGYGKAYILPLDAQGRPLVLDGHKQGVKSLAFAPAGDLLATACKDNQVRLWDVGTGRQVQALDQNRAEVNGVSFSCDGQFLASASWDGTVGLWRRGAEQKAGVEERKAEEESAKSVPSAVDSFDDVYVATAATGEKIPHPLSRKTYKQTLADGATIDVPDGMVYVPEGECLMGLPQSGPLGPRHKVWLDSYCIAKFKVTNGEWKTFVDDTRRAPPVHWRDGKIPDGRENHPVVNVTYRDATDYCEWINRKRENLAAGGKWREWRVQLPTEAQWEKAAAGPAGLRYPWGNDWDSTLSNNGGLLLTQLGLASGNVSKEELIRRQDEFQKALKAWEQSEKGKEANALGGNTTPVGAFPRDKSGYGCYDMAGIAADWCADWAGDYPTDGKVERNPQGPPRERAWTRNGAPLRVIRGGAWRQILACNCETNARFGIPVDTRRNTQGLRIALVQRPEAEGAGAGPAGKGAGIAASPQPETQDAKVGAPPSRSPWSDVSVTVEVTGVKQIIPVPEALVRAVESSQGLVVVGGPMGSGKSTTRAALLEHLNATRTCRICTIESTVSARLTPKRAVVRQLQVGRDAPDVVAAIASALHQGLGVLFVSPGSDLNRAQELCAEISAAETGHLVIIEMGADSPERVVKQIVDYFPAEQQQAVRQRLAGVLCAVSVQVLLRKAGGSGRVAAYDLLVPDDEARRAIAEGGTVPASALTKPGCRKLTESIQRLRDKGIVTAEEAERALATQLLERGTHGKP